MEEKGFAKLIKELPKDWKVLDVGCGGLGGENTSNYLVEHFGEENITGICKWRKDVGAFKQKHPNVDMIEADYYELDIKDKYDLVVLDLNIENNLKDWSEEGIKRTRALLKPNGIFINYIMMTDDYGDPNETPKLIQQHRKDWWRSNEFTNEMIGRRLDGVVDIAGLEQEERRPTIYWIAMK